MKTVKLVKQVPYINYLLWFKKSITYQYWNRAFQHNNAWPRVALQPKLELRPPIAQKNQFYFPQHRIGRLLWLSEWFLVHRRTLLCDHYFRARCKPTKNKIGRGMTVQFCFGKVKRVYQWIEFFPWLVSMQISNALAS